MDNGETLKCPIDGHTCRRAACLENPPDPQCTQAAKNLAIASIVFGRLDAQLVNPDKDPHQLDLTVLDAKAIKIVCKPLKVDPRLMIDYIQENLVSPGMEYTVRAF